LPTKEEEEKEEEETVRTKVQYSADYMLRVYARTQAVTTVKLTSSLLSTQKSEDINFSLVRACNLAYILYM